MNVLPVSSEREMRRTTACPLLCSYILLTSLMVVMAFAGFAGPARADDSSLFDLTEFSARALDSVGQDFTVAGGRPYEATASFSFTTTNEGHSSVEAVKDVFTELPPGFLGSLAGLPRCASSQLASGLFPDCPPGSEVGVLYLGTQGDPPGAYALYNMIPDRGYPASLAFKLLGNSIVTYVQVGPRTSHYAGTVVALGASDLGITSLGVTLYGVPSERNGFGGPRVPFLSNPADCLVAQPVTTIIVDSWPHPGRQRADRLPGSHRSDVEDEDLARAAGDGLRRAGTGVAVRAEHRRATDAGIGTSQADAPSGYTVDLDFPQTNDPTDSSSHVRSRRCRRRRR